MGISDSANRENLKKIIIASRKDLLCKKFGKTLKDMKGYIKLVILVG